MWTPDHLVLGVDSKETFLSPYHEPTTSTECKLRQIGPYYVLVSGVMQHRRSGFDVWKVIGESVSHTGSVTEAAADAADEISRRWDDVLRVARDGPNRDYRRELESNAPVFAIAGFSEGRPYLAYYEYDPTSLFTAATYVGILTRFDKWGGLSVVAWNPEEKSEIFISKGVRLFVVIPDLGWLLLLVLAAVAAPLVLYLVWRKTHDEGLLDIANQAVFLSILLQALALIFFLIRARDGHYASLDADGLFATSLAASPFILSGLVGGIFMSLMYLLLLWRREDLERMLPSADELDRITYKTIAIAFPLLTLMIAAGAYWANRTWGSYWSWDPKETWAAITWLVYAGYLHMRITRGWRGRRAAYFAILGFAVVMFTFFGVTYLLPGMHAYA